MDLPKDLFSGPKVLEKKKSKINGEIKVIKTLGLGTYIQVNGLTQSGGVVINVWKTVLKKIKKENKKRKNCLILGLGGGSAAKLIHRYWPESKITAVDIDKVIVNLGRKYLALSELNLDIYIKDAEKFIAGEIKKKKKYDLILIDMYVGYEIPQKFNNTKFIETIKQSLNKKGIAIFNRLYFDDKRPLAIKFGKKLEDVFSEVRYIYPEANLMFVCKNI